MSLQEDFEKAKEDIQGLPDKPSNNDLLTLYGLFKQSTTGDISGKRPGQFELFDRAKFDAWRRLKGTSTDEAMQKYIDKVTDMLSA